MFSSKIRNKGRNAMTDHRIRNYIKHMQILEKLLLAKEIRN